MAGGPTPPTTQHTPPHLAHLAPTILHVLKHATLPTPSTRATSPAYLPSFPHPHLLRGTAAQRTRTLHPHARMARARAGACSHHCLAAALHRRYYIAVWWRRRASTRRGGERRGAGAATVYLLPFFISCAAGGHSPCRTMRRYEPRIRRVL